MRCPFSEVQSGWGVSRLKGDGSQEIFPDTFVPSALWGSERRGEGDKAEWKETKIRKAGRGQAEWGRDRWMAGYSRNFLRKLSLGPLPSANPFFWQRHPRLRSTAGLELLFRRVESRLARSKERLVAKDKPGRSSTRDLKPIPVSFPGAQRVAFEWRNADHWENRRFFIYTCKERIKRHGFSESCWEQW